MEPTRLKCVTSDVNWFNGPLQRVYRGFYNRSHGSRHSSRVFTACRALSGAAERLAVAHEMPRHYVVAVFTARPRRTAPACEAPLYRSRDGFSRVRPMGRANLRSTRTSRRVQPYTMDGPRQLAKRPHLTARRVPPYAMDGPRQPPKRLSFHVAAGFIARSRSPHPHAKYLHIKRGRFHRVRPAHIFLYTGKGQAHKPALYPSAFCTARSVIVRSPSGSPADRCHACRAHCPVHPLIPPRTEMPAHR